MSGRRRAVATIGIATLAGFSGALLVGSREAGGGHPFGPLRNVLVSTAPIEAGEPFTARGIAAGVGPRRVPTRFIPSGAISSPDLLVGLHPVTDLPAGAYLTAEVMARGGRSRPRSDRSRRGRSAVELSARVAAATPSPGAVVDVLVTPDTLGRARTFVAARGVALLGTGAAAGGPGEEGFETVVLDLTRAQAIRLVDAEARGNSITVIPGRPEGR